MISNREEELRQALTFTDSTIPERISADPEVVENGLARLVLSIIELVRRSDVAAVLAAGEALKRDFPHVPFLLSGPWPLEVFADDHQ